MTDAEKLFRQTERERKKLGYGDKHKKRGGGRYVRLPSDNLSKKEREAMNGEIKTWKMKDFYTWEEFKELPNDEQVRWANSIINRYGCSARSISKIVFGMSATLLPNHFRRRDELQYINDGVKGAGGRKGEFKLQEAFENWKKNSETRVKAPEAVPEEVPDPVLDEAKKEAPKELPVEAPKTVWSDFANIALLLHNLAGTGAKLTIEVTL